MSGLRPPVFGGVAAGVGTTTLARALHGVDGGLARGVRPAGGAVADVLVCRVDSLAHVAGLSSPVLAVVADRPPRLDRIASRFGAIVTVPDIAAWHGLDAPEVAGLLAVAPGRRPARMQAFVDALLAVTAAVLRSGVLVRSDAAGRGHHRGAAPGPGPSGRAPAERAPRPPVAAVPARPSRAVPTPPSRAVPIPPARPGAVPTRPSTGPSPAAGVSSAPRPSPAVPGTTARPDLPPARAVPPGPVVPAPVPAPLLAVPAPVARVPVTPVPAVPDGALWRGLRAVERAPVPLRVAPPAPVPLRRSTATAPVPVHGRALRLRSDPVGDARLDHAPVDHAPLDDDALDDDALGSMRAG